MMTRLNKALDKIGQNIRKDTDQWANKDEEQMSARETSLEIRAGEYDTVPAFPPNRAAQKSESNFDHRFERSHSSDYTSVQLLCRFYFVFSIFASRAFSSVPSELTRYLYRENETNDLPSSWNVSQSKNENAAQEINCT